MTRSSLEAAWTPTSGSEKRAAGPQLDTVQTHLRQRGRSRNERGAWRRSGRVVFAAAFCDPTVARHLQAAWSSE